MVKGKIQKERFRESDASPCLMVNLACPPFHIPYTHFGGK